MSISPAASRSGSLFVLVGQHVARRPWLVLLLLLPLMVAVPYVGPKINPTLTGDESGYLRLANNLTHGHYLTGRNNEVIGGDQYPNLWFGPGLPLVMAPLVALHAPTSLIRLLGPLFLLLAAIFFFYFLRLYVSPRTAAFGAAAFGLYLPFYTVLEHLYSETLAVLLIVVMMYGTQRYLDEGRRRNLLLAGFALGWLALTRVAFGWVLTAMLVLALVWWAVRRGVAPRRFTAVCCVAALVCAPWLAYTYSVTKQPLYWGSSGALSLYWMSSSYPGERGDWQQARAVFSDRNLAPQRPFFRSIASRPLVDQNSSLLHAALANIRAHPARYAKNILANVSRMWFDFPYSFRTERISVLLFVIPNAILLTALLVSLGLVIRRPDLLPVEAVPFGFFALSAFSLHALLSAYPRMLFAVVPVIFWLVILVMSRSIRLVSPATGA